MALASAGTLAVFVALLVWLARRSLGGATLGRNTLLALVAGILLGAAVQLLFADHPAALDSTMGWIGLVGSGYVRLLQMIVMPLVLVTILAAVAKLDDVRSLGGISAGVLGLLMVTTAASALIGVGMARLFGLSAEGMIPDLREMERGVSLEGRVGEVSNLNLPDLLLSFLPDNPFADLAGSRPTSIIAVVIFATLLGLAALALRREDPERGARIVAGVDVVQGWVMALVRMVIRLTPFGVLGLMTRMVATSDPADILDLIGFVVASYIGLAIILGMHAGLLLLSGVNPARYYREVWPVLTFAFSSRSSAATIPLNIETQIDRLDVPPAVANFSATFGATIGQNGCAGLYPAMLAVMIAPTVGIDPSNPGFILSIVFVATIGSFGIAGVGGGATFAALLVLSTLNLPVALAGLLISIEPLIDMGRTAINVNGAMTAGTITSRILGRGGPAPAISTSAGSIEGLNAPERETAAR